ncbi:MAG TPA: COX15/CtaA family protein [Vicinamibacterales bacterium]|jgi:cytochrome c oxidase assembly protein subunit 15
MNDRDPHLATGALRVAPRATLWHHRFAKAVAACTVLLITAGGMVTSTDSGLSVPDWPTTYGWNMFTFPLSKWVGGIRYEHTHRLIASTVGFLTIVLAVWTWRVEPRAWVRRLGFAALGAVILQGVLGGITVLLFLPPAVSIGHAGLAQIFFCLTVTLALVTSPGWTYTVDPVDDRMLRRVAAVTTALIYSQILIGATMRHNAAGLAIPDFPLAFGHLIPPVWNAKVALNFAHRVGALVVTTAIVATSSHVLYHHPRRRELAWPALLLLGLVAVQITLGAFVVWSGRNPAINTAHVVNGAAVLGTSLVLTLRSFRAGFERLVQPIRMPQREASGLGALPPRGVQP